MDSLTLCLLLLASLALGLLSGLLGLGGGLLLIPGLVYLPTQLGLSLAVSVHQATGIAAVQSLVGGGTAWWSHYNLKTVRFGPIIWFGIPAAIFSYLGAEYANHLPDFALKLVLLVTLAIALGLLYAKKTPHQADLVSEETTRPPHPHWIKNLLVILFTCFTGFLAGNLGIGGGIFMAPMMIGILGYPLRLAIGSNAGIVTLTALFSTYSKWQHGVILPDLALIAIAGAIPGAIIGTKLSKHCSEKILKRCMAGIMIIAILRVGFDILPTLTTDGFSFLSGLLHNGFNFNCV